MRTSREAAFDINRGINENHMAEQDLLNIQQAMQQMQEQHQREIAAIRQQMEQPERMFQLTADQILNKFQKIKTFYGTEDYKLQEFISAVENVGALCVNNQALLQNGLQTIVREKVQGDAKTCIQRLGNNLTWDQVKSELKIQFRPRKSYKKLMDESRNIKVNNLRELFETFRSINFQLNELYDFDENRPTNYSPENNDKNLVDIIKDMLTGSYRVNIRNNMTLNEVYNEFDDLNLLYESDVIHYNYRKNNRDSKPSNGYRKDFKRFENDQNRNFGQYRNNSGQYRQNDGQYRNNSGQYRQNDNFRHDRNFHNNNRSGQHRQYNDQQRPHNNYNNPNIHPGQFRQGQNRSSPNNNNHNVVPMEVENIQNRDVNFTNRPRKTGCP